MSDGRSPHGERGLKWLDLIVYGFRLRVALLMESVD